MMGVNDPRVPERMTGGVDLTGSVDLSSPEQVADYLARLNAQPDVLQTISGGVNDLGISIGDLADHDGSKGFREDKEHADALAEVRGAYDGTAVRVLPASRFRAQRITLAPGTTAWIGQRDPRRLSCGIVVSDPTNAVQYAYVGPDITSVLSSGFELVTGTWAPYGIVLTHGDQIAIGAAAANTQPVTVSIAIEVQE